MAVKGIFLASLLFVCCVVVSSKPNLIPLHASCKLTWSFSVNCSVVHDKIRNQMIIWSTNSSCNNSEKCGYSIKSDSGDTIEGTHTTPVHHYVDDLTMSFAIGGTSMTCTVKGYSTSEIFYAIFDKGTNYCNLHNLVVGAKINTAAYGFKENTSNSVCTEYSSADCSKY